jgi:O-antigen ligase
VLDLLIATRVFSDYLWEYKAASVINVILFLLASITYAIFSKRAFRATSTDKIFILFLVSIIIAEVINPATRSLLELAKFLAYFALYISGRLGPIRLAKPKVLGVFCLIPLFGFSLAALRGYGYQDWGAVPTFSGGYFFKTDMAISALIFLMLVCTTSSIFISLAAVTLASYIVFKTNTRIALPLCLIIPLLALLFRSGHVKRIDLKLVLYVVLAAAAAMGLFLVIDFSDLGLLGFNFDDPYSAANTQGRSVIWAALLDGFMGAEPVKQIFGLGLGADAALTSAFSESRQLEGVRAHSSYLYLLVCGGISGSLLFFALILSIMRFIPILLAAGDKASLSIAMLASLLIFVFFWVSLTTEIIIRAQLMSLVFYLSGIVVQRSLYLKQLKNGAKMFAETVDSASLADCSAPQR